MVSREIWKNTYTHECFKNAQITLVLCTRAILHIFDKLTRACFSKIALETILLPILIIIIIIIIIITLIIFIIITIIIIILIITIIIIIIVIYISD